MSDQVNIASYLPRMAAELPFKPAIIFPHGRDKQGNVSYTHYTYRQLDQRSNEIARGLRSVGIVEGTRCALMVKPSLDLFALVFALFKVGAVPVMIDPGIGLKNLKTCLGKAEPEAFIGITAAHVARMTLGWGKETLKILITVGRKLFWGGWTLEEIRRRGVSPDPFEMAPTQASDTAAILFTSGSTGPPKGVVYRHETFATQVESIRGLFDIQPGDVNLPTFPLFALFDPALGMTTVIPDMDSRKPAQVDPTKIIEAIQDFGVTTMFGSPALLNTVGRYGEKHKIKLPTLKRVMSAGAPVPASVLRRFAKMMAEGGTIFPPYGATESLPVAVMTHQEILSETWDMTEKGHGVCVGRPIEGADVKIIQISDEAIAEWTDALVLPTGEIGEITVQGPMVTHAYYNNPRHTKLAKIQHNGKVRHRMGDLGYLDEKGRLWMCGRKSHRVETPEKTFFSVPCEAIFNAHPRVYRTALVPCGPQPLLCVELESGVPESSWPTILQELKSMGAEYDITREIQEFRRHPGFPVDIRHNAKIRREALKSWAAKNQ